MVVQCTFVLCLTMNNLEVIIMSSKLQVETTWMGPAWTYSKRSDGFMRTNGDSNVFVKRASKVNNKMFAVIHNGKFISNHRSISKAKEVAEALV